MSTGQSSAISCAPFGSQVEKTSLPLVGHLFAVPANSSELLGSPILLTGACAGVKRQFDKNDEDEQVMPAKRFHSSTSGFWSPSIALLSTSTTVRIEPCSPSKLLLSPPQQSLVKMEEPRSPSIELLSLRSQAPRSPSIVPLSPLLKTEVRSPSVILLSPPSKTEPRSTSVTVISPPKPSSYSRKHRSRKTPVTFNKKLLRSPSIVCISPRRAKRSPSSPFPSLVVKEEKPHNTMKVISGLVTVGSVFSSLNAASDAVLSQEEHMGYKWV